MTCSEISARKGMCFNRNWLYDYIIRVANIDNLFVQAE